MIDGSAWPLNYRQYGDTRPPAADLNQLGEFILAHPSAKRLVTLADVAIDLAMVDPSNCSIYIGTAETALTEIVRDAETAASENDLVLAQKLVPYAISAYLRRAELGTWTQAARDEPIEPNYEKLLEAAIKAGRCVDYDHKSEASFIEFMPVLLGARALGGDQGWVARLSLVREDERPLVKEEEARRNSNWGVGIVKKPDAQNYAEPPFKLQIKKTGSSGRGWQRSSSYERAGVAVVIADQLRLDDPGSIIAACAAECDKPHSIAVRRRLPSSEQLDEITDYLYRTLEILQDTVAADA